MLILMFALLSDTTQKLLRINDTPQPPASNWKSEYVDLLLHPLIYLILRIKKTLLLLNLSSGKLLSFVCFLFCINATGLFTSFLYFFCIWS